MDLFGSLLTFGLGAATIVIAQSVQGWRELKLDQARRNDDRKIDRGRAEAQTLVRLQEALNDLRKAMGDLHIAMKVVLSPAAELRVYGRARADVGLLAGRILLDPLRDAAEKAALLASLIASTDDEAARRELLGEFFRATDAAEELLKPDLREHLKAGYLKLE